MNCALAADTMGMGAGASAVRHPVAALILTLARGLVAVAHVLRRGGERLDGWLAARAKARADSVALLTMSDRELRDIGIDPGRIGAGPEIWRRDWTV